MAETVRERYGRWRLGELLLRHPGLRIRPSREDELCLAGSLAFLVQGPSGDPIEDSYQVEMRVPPAFPAVIPTVWETGGRIPDTHHKLVDGSLCLGAPTELRLRLGLAPMLITLVEGFVIPYLFGYSFLVRHGVMPFGELDHGPDGLRQHFAGLFGITDRAAAEAFVRLVSLRKRRANKEACPCGSGKRVGRCHNRRVNLLRSRLGRPWFREQYRNLRE